MDGRQAGATGAQVGAHELLREIGRGAQGSVFLARKLGTEHIVALKLVRLPSPEPREAAAQSGRHEDGRDTDGHTLVVDPWGTVLLDMGDRIGVGFAEIDAARVDDVRTRIPVIAHRRAIPPARIMP